jgi:hypothetical protein
MVMNILRISVSEKIKAHMITYLSPIIGTTALGIVLVLEDFLAKYIPTPTEIWAIRSIALSMLFLGLVFGTYFYFRPKFKHIPKIGVHQNIKTGAYFCSHCLLTKKLLSPMQDRKNNRGWQCPACGQLRDNPKYKEPESPSKNLGPNAWMAR